MRNFTRLLLFIACMLFGISAAIADEASDAAKPKESEASKAKETRKLMPNDILSIRVLGEQDLTVERRVADDGKITYPFLETLDVKGKTPAEVETMIHDGLAKDYLVNPQVMVDVKLYTSLKVNVIGSVNRPGPIELPPERKIDVLEAIGMAGDFSRLAQRNKIEVRREGEIHKFKFDELKNADPSKKFYVQADDVVYVPERVL